MTRASFASPAPAASSASLVTPACTMSTLAVGANAARSRRAESRSVTSARWRSLNAQKSRAQTSHDGRSNSSLNACSGRTGALS